MNLDVSQVRTLLRKRVQLEAAGNAAAWARAHRLPYPEFGQFLRGFVRKDRATDTPPADVLRALGLEKVTAYRKIRART